MAEPKFIITKDGMCLEVSVAGEPLYLKCADGVIVNNISENKEEELLQQKLNEMRDARLKRERDEKLANGLLKICVVCNKEFPSKEEYATETKCRQCGILEQHRNKTKEIADKFIGATIIECHIDEIWRDEIETFNLLNKDGDIYKITLEHEWDERSWIKYGYIRNKKD